MLDQILEQLPVKPGEAGAEAQQDVSQFVEMADGVLAEGDAERAAGIYAQVIDMAPTNVAAQAGLVRALVASGKVEEAKQVLDAALQDPQVAGDPLIEQAKIAVDLAGTQVDESELQSLKQKAEANPADMDAGLAYAEAAFAANQRDAAADTLLRMVEADREWNEGAARTKLLQIFEAVGLEDPWVVATRRRLSKILFG
jgi:putative thioredoxin